ncbi:MAG: S8 family serine peptidase, partial [Actinobacteria bacterium]|nr:S8 family serine peptidase [Actinomycetota bacterium]
MYRRSLLAVAACLAASIAATPAVPDLTVSGAAGTTAVADDLYALPFAARTVDPARDLRAEDPRGRDLVLVQFERTGATELVDALAGNGATLVQPLAPLSYIVQADAATTRSIRSLDGVRFAGVLPTDLRISASVDATTTLLRVTLVGDAADLATVAEASVTRRFTATDGVVLTLPGDAAVAKALAARPDVYSVAAAPTSYELRDERTTQIIVQDTAEPEVLPYDPVTAFGADGSGVRVAVVDGGVDTHHPELSDRSISCTDYVAQGAMCAAGNSDDVIGHGTFVTGVVMGDGSTGISDPDGFRFGAGVAPGADLHAQNAINLGGWLTQPSITELFTDSSRSGASVAQNSWGPAGTPQGYDEDTRQADVAVRDADPDEPGDQQLGVV